MKTFYHTTLFRTLEKTTALPLILLFSVATNCFSQINDKANDSVLREELLVMTDRDIYVAGEKIYLKIFKLDRYEHTPEDVSKIVYTQLIDSYNSSAAQVKIRVPGISGAGEIIIPDTIPTGNYFLCSSTSWMQNFSSGQFSYKRISVINPFETSHSVRLLHSDRQPDSIAFYPENGMIISGLNNLVGCRGYDSKGFPVSFNGSVIGSSGTKCEIKAEGDGIAFFSLKPKQGENFYIVTENDDTYSKRFNLPSIRESGYAISVRADDDNLIVAIQSSDNTDGRSSLLFSSASGESVRRVISNSDSLVFLRKKDLPEGFAVLTLTGNKGETLAKRWVYNERINNTLCDVKLRNTVYYPRDKVTVTVDVSDQTGAPSMSDLMISVVKSFSLDRNNTGSCPEYSQLPFLASISQDLKENSINNYLVLCPDIDSIVAFKSSKRSDGYSHLPELEGLIVSGRISDIETGLPLKNENVILSFVGNKSNCSFAKTTESGNFYFNTHVKGTQELVIQPVLPDPDGYFVEIDNPFPETILKEKMPSFLPDTNMLSQLNKAIISMQVKGIYDPYRVIKSQTDETSSSSDFYGEQLDKVYIEKYIELNSTREIIKEIVPALWIGKRDKKSYFRLASGQDSPPFEKEPLVLVDGVPVNDIDRILAINPNELERIELLRKRYYVSDMTFEGIVHFITKKANLSAIEFDNSLFRQEFRSVQNMPGFYSPDYSTDSLKNSRIPDFRNTLYWNPSLVTDKKGRAKAEFFTSDEPGEYSILVQGMTSEGKILRKLVKFVVVDRK